MTGATSIFSISLIKSAPLKARITRLYNWSKQQAAQPEQKLSIWEQLQQAQTAAQPITRYGKVKALTEYYGLRGEIAATARQIDELNRRLSMWKQYADNKPVCQRLADLKPREREKFQNAHSVELALYDAATWYLDELKSSGEKITPRHWQAETERQTWGDLQ